ncbi:MAG: hypothetical protein GY777_23080 [Candidatus Brocadiaceae bacterium]|nr:hypothetical protein [Candidatus Brocadiaceae bacterium]
MNIQILIIVLLIAVALYFTFSSKKQADIDQTPRPEFIAENTLEELLIRASQGDAVAQKEFYPVFWNSEIIISGTTDGKINGNGQLEADSKLMIQNFDFNGKPAIKIFTSLRRFQESITENREYVSMKAKDLFEIVGPQRAMLNPYSDYGKEFLPNEFAGLADGTINDAIRPMTVQKDTQVMLGQPSKYPTKLINALSSHFNELNSVSKAYLAHIVVPDENSVPHNVIGIKAVSGVDYREILNRTSHIIEANLDKNELLDFIPIEAGNAIADYMINETEPFYLR